MFHCSVQSSSKKLKKPKKQKIFNTWNNAKVRLGSLKNEGKKDIFSNKTHLVTQTYTAAIVTRSKDELIKSQHVQKILRYCQNCI